MSKLIILQEIRDLNQKINDEIEHYNHLLSKCETRLYILQEERRQLLELIAILEAEKNK